LVGSWLLFLLRKIERSLLRWGSEREGNICFIYFLSFGFEF
jgi:hypothetical protein